MKSIGIIPARYGSTRFPGKPLAEIGGEPMIRRVYGQAQKSGLDEVVVATDDARIAKVVRGFGGRAVMTDAELPSGTDRCREAFKILDTDADWIVNIQGAEPFIDPGQIDQVLGLLQTGDTDIATLISPAVSIDEVFNPNRVKVVVDAKGKALYFSRQSIPHFKGADPHEWTKHHLYYIHIGIYGFTREALMDIENLPPGKLEAAESLEQLRWLENGMTIATATTELRAESVDTPEDLHTLEKRYFL